MRGEDRPALDEQDRDVVTRKLDRGGEAGRARPDYQRGDVFDLVLYETHGRHPRRAGARAPEQRLLIRPGSSRPLAHCS
jgi:hypothetical protein